MDIQTDISHLVTSPLEEEAKGVARDPQTAAAAKKFESLLATVLVKEMRKGLDGGIFGQMPGSDIFEGWFDQHIGESLAKSGSLDLAGLIRVGIQTKADSINAEVSK